MDTGLWRKSENKVLFPTATASKIEIILNLPFKLFQHSYPFINKMQ